MSHFYAKPAPVNLFRLCAWQVNNYDDSTGMLAVWNAETGAVEGRVVWTTRGGVERLSYQDPAAEHVDAAEAWLRENAGGAAADALDFSVYFGRSGGPDTNYAAAVRRNAQALAAMAEMGDALNAIRDSGRESAAAGVPRDGGCFDVLGDRDDVAGWAILEAWRQGWDSAAAGAA